MKILSLVLAPSIALCALASTGCKSGPLPADAVWKRWEGSETSDQDSSLEVRVAGKSPMVGAGADPARVPIVSRSSDSSFEVDLNVEMTARVLRSQTRNLVSGRWAYPDNKTEEAVQVKPDDPIPEGAPPIRDLPARKWVNVDRPAQFSWTVTLKLSHTDGERREIQWSGTKPLTGTEDVLRISEPTEQLSSRIDALVSELPKGSRRFVLEVTVSCPAGTTEKPVDQKWVLRGTKLLTMEDVLGTRRTASAAP